MKRFDKKAEVFQGKNGDFQREKSTYPSLLVTEALVILVL